jgi:hypothetical protein
LSTIALELFAAMIKLGDLTPIHRGDLRREHCTDAASETLFDFCANYRQMTDGQGRVPSLSVIKDRFPHISLPEPPEQIDLPGLVYEAKVYKTKLNVQELVDKMVDAIEATDPIAALRTVRMQFDQVMSTMSSATDLSFKEAALDIIDKYQQGNILPEGIPWPWPSLHKATSGMHKGQFYVIAGRPKSRKTFIALYIGAFLVKFFGLRVLFVSPEMPPMQVMLRFVAFMAEVEYSAFKKSELSKEDEDRLYDEISGFLDTLDGILDDPTGNTEDAVGYLGPNAEDIPRGTEPAFIVTKATGQTVSFIEMKIKEHRPDVVIVDSFYRIGAVGARASDPDWKQMTSVSRHLKDMAMEQDVVVIGTHQLNRDADQKVGSIANLALSDAVGQDCDLAIRVITAKRTTGDKSALYVLGGRETDCDGVFIHNEPCSNFTEIGPIGPGMRKKLLEMMVEEDEVDQAEDGQTSGGKPPANMRGDKTKAAAAVTAKLKGKSSSVSNFTNGNGKGMSNAMPKRAAETVSASMVAANPIRPEDLDPDTDEAEAAEE